MQVWATLILSVVCVLFVAAPAEVFALVAIIVALVSIWAARYLYNNSYSPVAIFAVGWLLPASSVIFVPSHIKFDGWEVQHELWLAVFVSYVSFVVGHVFYVLLFMSNTKFSKIKLNMPCDDNRSKYFLEGKYYYRLIHFLFIIGMIGFGLNISNVIMAGGLGLYLELGLRDVEVIFGKSTLINYMYFMNPLVLLIGTIYQSRFGYVKRISVMMLLSFITLFFIGLKSTIVFPSLIAIISYFLTGRKLRIKMVILTVLLILVGFQFVTIGRNIPFLLARNASWFEIMTYRMDDIYLYFANGYVNLQEEVVNLKRLKLGKESFQFVGELLDFVTGKREGHTNTILDDEPFYMYNEAYNTGTYLREHYRDFGFTGIIVFTMFFGYVSTAVYCNFLTNRSVSNIGIYSIVSVMLLDAFFSNHFFKIQYLFWIFVLFLSTPSAISLLSRVSRQSNA